MKVYRFHACDACGKPIDDKDEMLCVSCKAKTKQMKIDDIVLTKPKRIHYGFQLQTIAYTSLKIEDMTSYQKLLRIPTKITAFLDRSKIKEVFKADCFKDPADAYYIVRAIDDTFFHLEY